MLAIFGNIDNPLRRISNTSYGNLQEGGLINFVSNVVKMIIIAAGLFAFINLILAGFQYISSQGNPDNTTKAWSQIYMSIIGLVVMVAAFAIAGMIGMLLFNDASAILSPKIYGPGATTP